MHGECAVRAARVARRVTLGKLKMSIKPGAKKKVSVKLSKKGARLLRKAKRLKVRWRRWTRSRRRPRRGSGTTRCSGPSITLAESALHTPFASFSGTEAYPTLVEQAAVLLEHLANNHPLPDAKRAAFLLTARFCMPTA
jgi:hypothetical protein